MQDTVHCEKLALTTRIGFHEVELGVEQTVLVDLALACDFRVGPSRDDHRGLVDYYVLAAHLEAHVQARRYDLIEAMAVDIARETLRLYRDVRVRVRITKHPLDMPRVVSVGVECERVAADFPELAGA